MFAIPLAVKTLGTTILSKVRDYAKDKLLGITDSAKANPMMYAIPICIIALIAIIVIPNMSDIKEKFGIETTKSLSVKLAQEERNTDAVIKANDSLLAVQNHVTVLDKVEDDLTKAMVEEIKVANTKVTDITKTSNSKITKVVKDNKLSEQQKIKEISKINIDAMWASYCSFNQDDECKKAA